MKFVFERVFRAIFWGGKKYLLSHPKINVKVLCVFERKFVEAHTLPLPSELPTSSNNFSMKASLPYIFEHWSPHISLENTDPLYGPTVCSEATATFLGRQEDIMLSKVRDISTYQLGAAEMEKESLTPTQHCTRHPSSEPVHDVLLTLSMDH